MPKKTRENKEIRKYILMNVSGHTDTIGSLVAKKFGISRTAVAGYMHRLIRDGVLKARGRTKARHYAFKVISEVTFEISLSVGLPEDVVWRYRVLPHIKNVKQNVVDICQYGFTEILNNAIDHSGSDKAIISYEQTYEKIEMMITDYGIGIFEKIQKDFNLPDSRAALLELSKGKLTSDKKNHAGEGIFFTSRMFDQFSILSGKLFYSRERDDDDQWLIETKDKPKYERGTAVFMEISPQTDRTKRSVFDLYQRDKDKVLSFRKTHVPLKLGQYPGEQLVSRSQAKRILSRFDNFSEVLLDFKGVEDIGQPFADEVFRVFHQEHPEIEIITINTTPEIDKMIEYVERRGREP